MIVLVQCQAVHRWVDPQTLADGYARSTALDLADDVCAQHVFVAVGVMDVLFDVVNVFYVTYVLVELVLFLP